jgi:hypothetical protein
VMSSAFWPDDVPERFRCDTPRDLNERLAYFEFYIARWRRKMSAAMTHDDLVVYTKHLRALEKRLAETKEKLANAHECACCGAILTVSDRIGPECQGHPDKFPCNKFRRH